MSDSGISGNRLVVIEAIASGGLTMEDAARAAGVTSRTVRYWRAHSPLFAEAVRQAKNAAVEDVQQRVRGLVPKALQVVENVLDSPDHRDRYRAAMAVLDRVVGWANDQGEVEPLAVKDIPPDPLLRLLGKDGPVVWPVAESEEEGL